MFRGTCCSRWRPSPPPRPSRRRGRSPSRHPTRSRIQAKPGEANFFTVNWGNVAAGPDLHPEVRAITSASRRHAAWGAPPTGLDWPLRRRRPESDGDRPPRRRQRPRRVQQRPRRGTQRPVLRRGRRRRPAEPGQLRPARRRAGQRPAAAGRSRRRLRRHRRRRPGVDSLWLDTAFGGNGPITATFDGVADDGFAGESDNYGADLENLEGVSTAPRSTSSATPAPTVQMRSESADVLVGPGRRRHDRRRERQRRRRRRRRQRHDLRRRQRRSDQGRPGLDSLSGEGSGSGFFISVAGNDTIDARDGVREQLNCGPGADTAIVDELDVVPQDPGSLCEAVDRAGAAAAVGPAEHPLVEADREQGPREHLAVVQGRV